MKHRVIGVLIGVGAGILISYALYARAEVITYTAPELIEEPKEVVVEIETEGQKIERLVREEFEDINKGPLSAAYWADKVKW